MENLELKSIFHEDLSSHYCEDWLKAHVARFSRKKTLETGDLQNEIEQNEVQKQKR